MEAICGGSGASSVSIREQSTQVLEEILANLNAAQDYCCEPLLNFIKNGPHNLTIDFGGFDRQTSDEMDSWLSNYKKLVGKSSPITPGILLQICQQQRRGSTLPGLKLLNVHLNSLPNRNELSADQVSNLNSCIASILMIEPDETHRQKYFPPTAEIKLVISGPTILKISQNLNITTIHWLLWETLGVKNNPKDLIDLDPTIYQYLFKNDPKELIQYYVAQSLPIYIDHLLVNFELELCVKFPNLKWLTLFPLYGFRDYNYTFKEFIDMRNFQEDIFQFEF